MYIYIYLLLYNIIYIYIIELYYYNYLVDPTEVSDPRLPHHFTWSATDHDLYEGFGASGAVETVVFPWKKGVFSYGK